MRITRRTFRNALTRHLETAVGFAATLTAGQLLLGRKTTRPLYPGARTPYSHTGVGIIRPPGAVGEKEFLAGCIRCYRCQDVCDAGAIQFFTERDGRYFHTPYVDPSRAACDLCMACTQTCPTGVLQPMRPKDRNRVRMASVALDKDRCLSYKTKRIRHQQRLLKELGRPHEEVDAEAERRGICGECYMVCPRRENAITYEPGGFLAPVVHVDDCVGCGLCEEICRVVLRGEPAIRVVPTRQTI